MTVVAVAEGKLDINRVIRRTVEVLQRNCRSPLRPALLLLYLPGDALQPHRGPFGEREKAWGALQRRADLAAGAALRPSPGSGRNNPEA